MSNSIVRAAFVTEDGTVFSTRQEAIDHVRKPKIKAALMLLTPSEELADWLNNNSEDVAACFETSTVRRVSKKEKKILEDALNNLADVEGAEFLYNNREAVFESFRWPSVKRLTAEEKETAARNNVMGLTEGDQALTDWILENKDKILDAFEAGVVKQELPEKTRNALEEYRAKRAAEKAAKEAAKEAE